MSHMKFDYNFVKSISREEFDKLRPSDDVLKDPEKYTTATKSDMESIERLLDITSGILQTEPYYFENVDCQCGRKLTMYDFVFTAIVDGGHPKSFILHTLVGTKSVVNPARRVRCSACATRTVAEHTYNMGVHQYLCRGM